MRRTFFQGVMRAAAPRLFIPFYHAVCPDVPPHLKSLYMPRSPEQFERDIQTFLRYFDLADPIRCLDPIPSDKHQLIITFDDGLRSFADYAWPILKRYGIRPIVFVNPGLLDRKELMYRYKASALISDLKHQELPEHPIFNDRKANVLLEVNYANRCVLDEIARAVGLDWKDYWETHRPYLSWDELRALRDEGVYVGAHSMDHPDYGSLPAKEQVEQTKESIKRVQDELGVPYRFFSFPFSDHGVAPEVFQEVSMDLSLGTQKIKQEDRPRHVQRLHMERPGWSAEKILWIESAMFQVKRLIGRHRAEKD